MYELVKKYYKFPLEGFNSYIFDADDHMSLMYISNGISQESKQRLLDVLNGVEGVVFNSEKHKFSIKNGKIFSDDIEFMIVRGWGRLQYIKTDKPEDIQDEFGQWVVDTLNNYNAN